MLSTQYYAEFLLSMYDTPDPQYECAKVYHRWHLVVSLGDIGEPSTHSASIHVCRGVSSCRISQRCEACKSVYDVFDVRA